MCALPIRVLQCLDFTVNRVPMKCRYFELPSVQLQRRFEKFLANAANDDDVILTLNMFCIVS